MNKKVSLAVFMGVNILLGTGPIIIPMPFIKAGTILSLIWLIVNCMISYCTAKFISQYICRNLDIERDSFYRDFNQNNQAAPLFQHNDVHNKPYQYGDIGMRAYGLKGKYFFSISIIIYVSGVILTKCILTGKTLSLVFKQITFLDQYYVWLGIFFFISAVFSFKSVENTKPIQYLSMFMRFLTIILFIIGAIVVIFRQGSKGLKPQGYPLFHKSNFPQLFSNTIFAYNFHHSLTSIVVALTISQCNKALAYIYIFVLVVMIIIPITGVMAFGGELVNNGDLKYYNQNFNLPGLKWIYYITSFYIFLNVAALPVLTIVTRQNIFKILMPDLRPSFKASVIVTAILLTIIIGTAVVLKNHLQIVLDFTGGIFGIIIMIFCPCISLIKLKRLNVNSGIVPYSLIVIGILLLIYNVYLVIKKHM